MCVIICKRRGLNLPSHDVISKCFDHNSDGFGVAFNEKGSNRVTILKGAMKLKEVFRLVSKIKDPAKRDIIMHFRTATQGKICAENCHPFPLSAKTRWLKELAVTTPVAIAHNGIINVKDDGTKGFTSGGLTAEYSDTQNFIRHFLSGLGTTLLNKQVGKLIEGFAGGKFAILTSQGIRTLGEFAEEDGLSFSNTLWKPTVALTGDRLYGTCDFCGRYGEIVLLIPFLYACRFCHIGFDMPLDLFSPQGEYHRVHPASKENVGNDS